MSSSRFPYDLPRHGIKMLNRRAQSGPDSRPPTPKLALFKKVSTKTESLLRVIECFHDEVEVGFSVQ